MEVTRITADEVKQRLGRGEEMTMVDARSEKSWAEAEMQIPGSVRVPPDEVASHVDEIPRGRAILTYCT